MAPKTAYSTAVRHCLYCGKAMKKIRPGWGWYVRAKCCSRACASAHARTTGCRRKQRPVLTCIRCGMAIDMSHLKHPYPSNMKRKYCGNKGCRKFFKTGTILSDSAVAAAKGYAMTRNDSTGKKSFEHRVIAEAILGRPLKRTEVVHHLNGDKADNRHENLLICSNSYHHWFHQEMLRRYMKSHFGGVDAVHTHELWGC